MTSLMFMLLWVPLPVCQTARGKLPSRLPSRISSQAFSMSTAFSLGSVPSSQFAWAADFLRMAKAEITSGGIFSVPMRKFSKLRCVWAPQYLSQGTRISPMESCSFRRAGPFADFFVSLMMIDLPFLSLSCHCIISRRLCREKLELCILFCTFLLLFQDSKIFFLPYCCLFAYNGTYQHVGKEPWYGSCGLSIFLFCHELYSRSQ